MNEDPLQYIKDIQNMSWKDLGYSITMTKPLQNASNQQFIVGADMDGYFEDGGLSGVKVQNISANRIVTSELVAGVTVGSTTGGTYLKIDGPKKRFVSYTDGIPQIVIGNPN